MKAQKCDKIWIDEILRWQFICWTFHMSDLAIIHVTLMLTIKNKVNLFRPFTKI